MKPTPAILEQARRWLGGLAAVGALALPALAADPPAPFNFRRAQQSYELVGLTTVDAADQKVGRVTDLALDVENGRLVEVIVASGGFAGIGQRTVAVPPQALTYDPAGRVFRLNLDKEKFKAAPDFALAQWADHYQSHRVAADYRYYGQEPYFAADGQGSASGHTATEPLGIVQRSSKLMYLPVKNWQNEPLGRVRGFLCDLPSGRVLHVIVMSAGYLQTKCAVPATALRFNGTHDALYMDVTQQAFKDEPRFKWTTGQNGEYQQETYANTKVAANAGVNTRQNVQEGTARSYVPLAQGSSFADVDKTHRIYSAMRADASLSQLAQEVEVGTLNGRVTLRGHVNTEEGKRTIGGIARAAGQAENVSNLLEVRPPTPGKKLAN